MAQGSLLFQLSPVTCLTELAGQFYPIPYLDSICLSVLFREVSVCRRYIKIYCPLSLHEPRSLHCSLFALNQAVSLHYIHLR